MRPELIASPCCLERITLGSPLQSYVSNLQARSGQVADPEVALLKLVPSAELQACAHESHRGLDAVRSLR